MRLQLQWQLHEMELDALCRGMGKCIGRGAHSCNHGIPHLSACLNTLSACSPLCVYQLHAGGHVEQRGADSCRSNISL